MITNFILSFFFRGEWTNFAHWAGSLILFQLFVHLGCEPYMSATLALIPGLIKELFDYFIDGVINDQDLYFNLFGAVTGIILYLLISLIF